MKNIYFACDSCRKGTVVQGYSVASPSAVVGAVTGGLSGSFTGALIGSVIPLFGTIAGAAIGGFIGSAGGGIKYSEGSCVDCGATYSRDQMPRLRRKAVSKQETARIAKAIRGVGRDIAQRQHVSPPVMIGDIVTLRDGRSGVIHQLAPGFMLLSVSFNPPEAEWMQGEVIHIRRDRKTFWRE